MIDLSSDIIEIKFSGGEISPSKISLSELASHILIFERLIKPIIEVQQPDINLDKTFVSLQDLGNRSISLRYILKQHKPLLLSAFTFLIDSIATGNLEQLPSKTVDEIQYISKFNSKYKCGVELGETLEENFKNYVGFSDEYVSEKINSIKGYTTIYGKIQWIGGEKPTITLLLDNGDKVDVSVTEIDAKSWPPYSTIGVYGEATWKGKDLKLVRITAKEIFSYNKITPKQGFENLSQLFSNHHLSTDNI